MGKYMWQSTCRACSAPLAVCTTGKESVQRCRDLQCCLQPLRVHPGQLLKALARRFFHMPVCRFVDDFFAAEDAEVAEHSMKVFAE